MNRTVDMESKGNHQEWENRRKSTYHVYLFQSIFIGLELTIIQGALFPYLQRSVGPSHLKLWYDLVNAVIYLVPLLFGSCVGRFADKTRNVRGCLTLLNFCVLGGTFLYMLPFSPFLIFFGRFFHGFHFIIRSIVYSELSRIYSDSEVQEKIPAFITGLNIGCCIGPLSNMIFLNVDVWVGNLHLTYGNSSSLPLLILSVAQISLLTFCSHNVSKEYDLKAHDALKNSSNDISEKSKDNNKEVTSKDFPKTYKDGYMRLDTDCDSVVDTVEDHQEYEAIGINESMDSLGTCPELYTIPEEQTVEETFESTPANTNTEKENWSKRKNWLKGLLRGEFLMLMAMSLHSGFGITIFPRILPLLVSRLGYNENIVNYYFFGFAAFGTAIALLMTSLKLTNWELFVSGYASLVAFFFTMTSLCLTSAHLSYVANQILLIISTLSWAFYCATTKMFLIVTCNKFVTSTNQALGESIRANVTMIGRLTTAFATTFVYDNIFVFTIGNLALTAGFFVGMTIMRRTLSAPVASF